MDNELTNPLETIIAQLEAISSNDGAINPETYAFWKLHNQRCLFIDLGVDESALAFEKLIFLFNKEDEGLSVEERKPIKIYLMNWGGSLDMAYSLIDIMLASDTPVYTINLGQCASAAALIFLAGEKRYMMPNATVMIHQGSAEFKGDAGKIMDATESYKKALKRMKEYISERTEIPSTTLTKKKNDDWEMSSEECLKYKICTHIVRKLSEIL